MKADFRIVRPQDVECSMTITGSVLIWILSCCVVAVFAGITVRMSLGLIQAKIGVPLVLENILIGHYSPTKEFNLPVNPPFLIFVRQGANFRCPNYVVTAVWSNDAKSLVLHQGGIKNDLFFGHLPECGRMHIPWRFFSEFGRIVNANIIRWSVPTVFDPQAPLVIRDSPNFRRNVSPLRGEHRLLLMLQGYELTLSHIGGILRGLSLPIHRAQLRLHRSPLPSHYVSLLSIDQDLGHYRSKDQDVEKISGNELDRIGSAGHISTSANQTANNDGYYNGPTDNSASPHTRPPQSNPEPSLKPRPSILWLIGGLGMVAIGLLMLVNLIAHEINSEKL